MNHLNFRKLSLVIGIALVCVGILACQIPGMAGKSTRPTPEDTAHDPNLVAVWCEARRTGEDGIVLVDGFARPTTVFSYEHPASDSKVV